MSQLRKTAMASGCLVAGILLLQNPALAVAGFQSGLHLCMDSVLPALFPFFVLCDLLVCCLPGKNPMLRRLAGVFGMTATGLSVVLLSWVGGYAVCAKLTGTLYRQKILSGRDAARVVLLGCCSSPGFVIGCVGGMLLGNLRLGVLLYGLQLAANLLSAAVCLPLLPPMPLCLKDGGIPEATGGLSQAIGTAVQSSLQVCGCVLFFRVLGTVVSPVLPSWPIARPLVSAVLEISGGCADFAALSGRAALYGCCFCLSVLSLSVWAQLALLMQGAVSLPLLAVNRAIHLVVFSLLVHLLAKVLPGTLLVYSTLARRVIPMQRLPLDAAIVVFLFICAALYKVRQNFYNK